MNLMCLLGYYVYILLWKRLYLDMTFTLTFMWNGSGSNIAAVCGRYGQFG